MHNVLVYSLSFRAGVFHPNTRVDVRLLGPCFKTGRLPPLRQHPSRSAVLGPGRSYSVGGYNTPKSHIPLTFIRPPKPMLAVSSTCPDENIGWMEDTFWRQTLPFQQFHVLLTLFSKCFSSFDHSTCALSVSGQYLALDEIYHPFRAAFPNNSTRRRSLTWRNW